MKILFSLVFLFLSICTASAVEIDSIFIKSIGGNSAYDSLKNIKSVYTFGSAFLNGERGTFRQYLMPPDRYYLDLKFSNYSLTQAYDGETAWLKDINGKYSVVEGMEKKELLKNIYFESYAYMFDEYRHEKIKYLDTISQNGRSYYQLLFMPFPDDSTFVYYNIETGQRDFSTSRLDHLHMTSYFYDYEYKGGMLIPMYSKVVVEEASFITEFVTDSIAINNPIDETVFNMPIEKTENYHFPAGLSQIEIPFEYVTGHILIPVKINGVKKLRMILDSGASANIFHKPAVKELDLEIVGSLPAMGVAGYDEVKMLQTDSILIGGLTLYKMIAGSLDMNALMSNYRKIDNFGGLLGYDFLSRFPVLVDYTQKSLTVFNPDDFNPPAGGKEVQFYLTMQVPTITGELNGIEGDFIVDLGNALGLILHNRFIQNNSLLRQLDDVQENNKVFGGIGGAIGGKNAYAATFKMGDIMINSIRVILPDSSQGLAGSSKLAGNIGNMVLENFRVLFDYKNSRLIFYNADSLKY